MSIRTSFRSLLITLTTCLTAAMITMPTLADTLRIGTTANYPPFAFQKDGKMQGLDVQLAQRLSEHLGRPIEFSIIPINRRIPALISGEIDIIMAGMSVTPERAQRVSFSQPITTTGQMAIIHQRNIGRLGELRQMARHGHRIGVLHGSTGAKLVYEKFPGSMVMEFSSIDIALGTLAGDELDYVVHDAQTSWLINQNREYEDLISLNQLLNHEQIAWAVSPLNIALQQEINEFLRQIQQTGELKGLLRYWIPLTVNANQ